MKLIYVLLLAGCVASGYAQAQQQGREDTAVGRLCKTTLSICVREDWPATGTVPQEQSGAVERLLQGSGVQASGQVLTDAKPLTLSRAPFVAARQTALRDTCQPRSQGC